MRYAIMSDVHSNPQALATALADARARKCDRFLMLGDTTGYGYDGKAALDAVRANFDVVLMGNHDSACLGREPQWEVALNRNYDIDVAQRAELSAADREWLAARPFVAVEADAAFAHGNFIAPSGWGYILDAHGAAANFRARTERLMFCGHTHGAVAWELGPDGAVAPSVTFESAATKPESRGFRARKDRRYIVNVGSVGYPRHDLCIVYAIWDTATDRITYRRLPFDFQGYVAAMLARCRPLPLWLVDILQFAREHSETAE